MKWNTIKIMQTLRDTDNSLRSAGYFALQFTCPMARYERHTLALGDSLLKLDHRMGPIEHLNCRLVKLQIVVGVVCE